MKFNTIPNWITLIRFVLFFGVLGSLFSQNGTVRIIGFITYLLVFAMDKLDGYVARKYNMVTDVGKFFDLAVDRTIVSTLLVAYLFYFPSKLILLLLIANLIRDFLVGGIRQLAAYKNFFLKAHIAGKYKFICENTVVILMLALMSVPGISAYKENVIMGTNVILGISTVLGMWSLGLYLQQMFAIKD